jgi:hypothetical protein
MASAEHFGTGTTPAKTDTRRILICKRLNKIGGTALKSDTIRLLRGKIDRVLVGKSSANIGF